MLIELNSYYKNQIKASKLLSSRMKRVEASFNYNFNEILEFCYDYILAKGRNEMKANQIKRKRTSQSRKAFTHRN